LKFETNGFEDSLEKQLTLKPGKNSISLDYTNTKILGNYSVSCIAISDEIIIGPKYTYFEVIKKPFIQKLLYPFKRIFKINFRGFFKQTKSYRESYTVKKEGSKTILDYLSLDITIHIEQEEEKTLTRIRTIDGELTIEQEPSTIKYNLLTPEGSLIMVKEKGQIKQEVKGDEKFLRSVFDKMMNSYKDKIEELDLTS